MIKAMIWFPEDLEKEEIHVVLPCAPSIGDTANIDDKDWEIEAVRWNIDRYGEFDWIDVDLKKRD